MKYDEYQLFTRYRLGYHTMFLTEILIVVNILLCMRRPWASTMVQMTALLVLPGLYFITGAVFRNAYLEIGARHWVHGLWKMCIRDRYDAHIVDRILDSEGNLIKEIEPTVFNQIDLPDAVWDVVYEGMKGVVSPEDGGTAANYFSTSFREKYLSDTSEKRVAGKTGTAQITTVNQIDIENTSWFVAFGPIDDPEIVVVVCVPYGRSGSSSAPAVEDIFSSVSYTHLPKS